MKTVSLNGKWRMRGAGFDCFGTVPGSMYSFLLENKLIPDPYYRDNEFEALKLSYEEYAFERDFDYTEEAGEKLLRFEGLDTFCDVYLNGKHLGHTDNMHVCYELDASEALVEGRNTLRVECHPIFDYMREKASELELYPGTHTIHGFGYVRKASCMLGWDWGPFLPDCGIWRAVSLIIKNSARIEDVKVEQRHEGGKVFLTPNITVDGDAEVRVSLGTPDGKTYELSAGEEFEVPSPMLWWPRGLGEQPLYTVRYEIISHGEVLDATERRIGLRVLKLIREKDKWGEGFMHECNGIRFFAMGADYVPEDNIFSRCTPERSRVLLERCADANFNAIRIWGGGYYPDNWFFDICDELGLVVFFDMAFACTMYMPDEHQTESIRVEVAQNLRRLRHHPSIALISGNNEVESCNVWAHRDGRAAAVPACIELFEGVIADVAREVAPELPYIHTSPITAGRFIDPNNENFGDSHYWEVWHSGKPFTEYRNHHFRYLSEFGFQSFPCLKTVEAFTAPEDRNIFSRVMEQHQRNTAANAKIVAYLADTFLYPAEFGTLLYASQLLQAEAMKYGVEHMRRERGRCMGTLYWQLNDIWPVASWASIDYYGRLKALHYYAKRFYSPLLISCNETGEKTTRPYVILDPAEYTYETKASLSVTNDTLCDFKGLARGKLRNKNGEVLECFEFDVNVPALSVTHLPEIDFNRTDVCENYYSYELIAEDGTTVSEGTVLFTAPKHFNFADPELTVRREGEEIVVCAKAYAKSVEIYSDSEDFILSDNFFDINSGEVRVKILEGDPKFIKARCVYNIR